MLVLKSSRSLLMEEPMTKCSFLRNPTPPYIKIWYANHPEDIDPMKNLETVIESLLQYVDPDHSIDLYKLRCEEHLSVKVEESEDSTDEFYSASNSELITEPYSAGQISVESFKLSHESDETPKNPKGLGTDSAPGAISEVNDTNKSVSSDDLFDSISSDVINSCVENGEQNPSSPLPDGHGYELSEIERNELDNFNPLFEAWNNPWNKHNQQQVDLTLPGDTSVIKEKCDPRDQKVKWIIRDISSNIPKESLKNYLKNQCDGYDVKIETVNMDPNTNRAFVVVSRGSVEFQRCVHNSKFLGQTLRLDLQHERADPSLVKLQSQLNETSRILASGIRTTAEVTSSSTTQSGARAACRKAAEMRTTSSLASTSVISATGVVGSSSNIESTSGVGSMSRRAIVKSSEDGCTDNTNLSTEERLLSLSEVAEQNVVKPETVAKPDVTRNTNGMATTATVASVTAHSVHENNIKNDSPSHSTQSEIKSNAPLDLSQKPPKTRSTVPDDVQSSLSEQPQLTESQQSESQPSESQPSKSQLSQHQPSESQLSESVTSSTATQDDDDAGSLTIDLAGLVIIDEDEDLIKEQIPASSCERELTLEPSSSTIRWSDIGALTERLIASNIPLPRDVSCVMITCCETDGVWAVKDHASLKKYSKMLRLTSQELTVLQVDKLVVAKINQVFCRGLVLSKEQGGAAKVRLIDLGEIRTVPVDRLFAMKRDSKMRAREPLAKKYTFYRSGVRDGEMLCGLTDLLLTNKQVDMLEYEDGAVDFLITTELTVSSFVKIATMSGALRATRISDYPVTLNKTCDYTLIKKHLSFSNANVASQNTAHTHTTLCLKETRYTASVPNWESAIQRASCAPYTGGNYCLVVVDGVHYRGEILHTDLFVNEHVVYLVDTGAVLTTSSVFQLPASFFDVPAQVIRCQLISSKANGLSEGDILRGFISNEDNNLFLNILR